MKLELWPRDGGSVSCVRSERMARWKRRHKPEDLVRKMVRYMDRYDISPSKEAYDTNAEYFFWLTVVLAARTKVIARRNSERRNKQKRLAFPLAKNEKQLPN